MDEKRKKKHFSEAVIQVLLIIVQAKHILFNSVSSGQGQGRLKQDIGLAVAVNSVSQVLCTMQQVKQKWLNMNLEAKKKVLISKNEFSLSNEGLSYDSCTLFIANFVYVLIFYCN